MCCSWHLCVGRQSCIMHLWFQSARCAWWPSSLHATGCRLSMQNRPESMQWRGRAVFATSAREICARVTFSSAHTTMLLPGKSPCIIVSCFHITLWCLLLFLYWMTKEENSNIPWICIESLVFYSRDIGLLCEQ